MLSFAVYHTSVHIVT